MYLSRCLFAQRHVKRRAMILGDPPADAGAPLRSGLEGVEVDALLFERAPEPLDDTLSSRRPLPFIDMGMLDSASTALNRDLCTGFPNRC